MTTSKTDTSLDAVLIATRDLAAAYIKRIYDSLPAVTEADLSAGRREYQRQRLEMEFQKYMGAQTAVIADARAQTAKDAALLHLAGIEEMFEVAVLTFCTKETPVNQALDQTIMAPAGNRKALENLGDFDGSHAKWPGFRDLFRALVIEPGFSALESFLLLQKHCKGPSQEIVSGYPPVADSFELAWNALTEIFDDKYSITQSLVDKLIELPPTKDRSVSEIRRVIDTFRSTLRQLTTLGCAVTGWDAFIINLMARKVPSSIVHEWEQNRVRTESPTLVEFLKFLEGKARLRVFNSEYVGGRKFNKPTVVSHDSDPSTRVSNVGTSDANSKNNSGANMNANKRPLFSKKGGSLECYKCKANHSLYRCNEFLAIANVKDRAAEVLKWGACANCLSSTHQTNKCEREGCRQCDGAKHCRLLCSKVDASKNNQRVNHVGNTKKKPRTE
jgi:hypothetical protein